MDEMDLEGTLARQPDDPFGGDAAVSAEQPAQNEKELAANQKVKLGSQIWRLVFSVIYLLICVLLANSEIDYQYKGFNSSLAAPVVILIFSIIGLVLAIVNNFLVKEKANRSEM